MKNPNRSHSLFLWAIGAGLLMWTSTAHAAPSPAPNTSNTTTSTPTNTATTPTACIPLDAPPAPTGLTASSGDATVTLTWIPPSRSSCADFYTISYIYIGPQGTKGPVNKVQTTNTTATIGGLENGVNYAFYVESGSNDKRFNKTAPALVTSVPRAPCDPSQAPSAPTNVTAFGGEGTGIRLCWKAPKGPGCTNEYRVAIKIVPLTEAEVQSATWQYQQLSTAGCMTYNNLQDRRSYIFAVQSYSNTARSGSYATTQATVVKDWRCMPVNAFYPLCKSAASGQCNPMTCAEQASSGRCASPWLRQLDKTTKTVIQYCAEACSCSVTDLNNNNNGTQAAVAMVSGDVPGVRRFDGFDYYKNMNLMVYNGSNSNYYWSFYQNDDQCCRWA